MIAYILTDVCHLLKILVLCDFIFKFHKRNNVRRYIIPEIVGLLVLSILLFYSNRGALAVFIYSVILFLIIISIYKDNKFEILFSGIWILFWTSMLDLMSTEIMNLLFKIFGYGNIQVERFVASIISLLFVYILGKIYSNKYATGIKKIGILKLFLFTALTFADAMVVMFMAVISIEKYTGEHKLVYYISFIFVIIGIFVQLAAVILLIMSRDTYKEKEKITGKYLDEQKKHYEYLVTRETETKKFRHDLKQHMGVLSKMAEQKEYHQFDDYMEKINIKIENFGNIITVNNSIVDAIINKYYAEAEQKEIKITVKGTLPDYCNIEAYDLCTIFSNILSNAIEATEKADKKEIFIECRYLDEKIIITERNTFKDEGQFYNGKIITSKKEPEYHGFGMKNIEDAVRRNQGEMDIEILKNQFSIMIMLANREE